MILDDHAFIWNASRTDVEHIGVCVTCWNVLKRKDNAKTPRFPLCKYWPGTVPPELRDLNMAESMAIARCVPMAKIFQLSVGADGATRQWGYTGHTIVFAAEAAHVASALPHSAVNLSEAVRVIFVGPSHVISDEVLRVKWHLRQIYGVEHDKLVLALRILCEQHSYYNNGQVTLDDTALRQFADDPDIMVKQVAFVQTTDAQPVGEGRTVDVVQQEQLNYAPRPTVGASLDSFPVISSGLIDVDGVKIRQRDRLYSACEWLGRARDAATAGGRSQTRRACHHRHR